MKTKKIILIFAVVLFSIAIFSNAAEFEEGGKYLTPQVGINTYAIPFGVSFGYGVSDNIEIAGSVLYLSWGEALFNYTVIAPALEGFYHFTSIKVEKLDVFAGLSLGYLIFTGDLGNFSSGLSISPFVGSRYYFSKNTAASLKLYFSTGSLGGVGGVAGVTFRL